MDVQLHQILLVYAAYVIAAGSPGPSTMLISGVAMNHGRRAALMLSAGVVTGSVFWGMMAATGVSAILTRYAEALIVLKIFGGFYLLFLAFKAGRSALTPDENIVVRAGADTSAFSPWLLYRRGLLMHLSNPKSVLGWIALVTLGLGPDASLKTVSAILGGCAVLSVVIFGGYALVFSTAPMVRLYKRGRRWIEGTLAAVYGCACDCRVPETERGQDLRQPASNCQNCSIFTNSPDGIERKLWYFLLNQERGVHRCAILS